MFEKYSINNIDIVPFLHVFNWKSNKHKKINKQPIKWSTGLIDIAVKVNKGLSIVCIKYSQINDSS